MSAQSIDGARLPDCLRELSTVDLRDPEEQRLLDEEAALAACLMRLADTERLSISVERLARFQPVTFDPGIVACIEQSARMRGHSVERKTSGAGHNAQMIARIAPLAMIFAPSLGGISHSPREDTPDADLVAGAKVLLDVAIQLAGG